MSTHFDTSRPGRMTRLLASAISLATLGIAACGIPLDDSPRDLTISTSTTPDQKSSNQAGPIRGYIYLISDNLVVDSDVDLASNAPDDTLAALLGSTRTGESLVTQIPAGTKLRSTNIRDGLLTVDLSKEFDNLVGTGRTLATAQIVLTATESKSVTSVAFQIDGQPTQVFSPEFGDVDQVSDCDYVALLPTDDQVDKMSLTTKARRHLITRRNTLSASCNNRG